MTRYNGNPDRRLPRKPNVAVTRHGGPIDQAQAMIIASMAGHAVVAEHAAAVRRPHRPAPPTPPRRPTPPRVNVPTPTEPGAYSPQAIEG
jgi:hypothetical protein